MSLPHYPNYKDSGVEWLGAVPRHWGVKRLKRNLSLLTEKTDRRENPVTLETLRGLTDLFQRKLIFKVTALPSMQVLMKHHKLKNLGKHATPVNDGKNPSAANY